MADAKITELSAIAAIAGEDLLAVVDDPSGTPATTKATVTQVLAYIVAQANTWTATQTITPAANSNALASTGYSLTGSNAQSLIDLAGTWNTSGTPTALKLNITDTASNAVSLLMDLQVGGSSAFQVAKNGVTRVWQIGVSALSFAEIGGNSQVRLRDTAILAWTNGGAGATSDLFIARRAAANLRFGAADAAAPVAQTLSVQSVVAGTSNTAGANLTITGSQGTGTGAGGSIIFQVAPAGSTGTAQNTLATALTINAARQIVGTEISTTSPSFCTGASTTSGFSTANGFDWFYVRTGTPYIQFGFDTFRLASSCILSFSATSSASGSADTGLARAAAGVLRVSNGSTGGAAMQFDEMTAPAAPSANAVRIYAEDNGGGKTRLMALFPSGAAQQIAIEP